MELRDILLSWCADLQHDDIYVPTTSQPGRDIHFSPKAQAIYPYSIECKNVEKLNIWQAYAQAETHQSKEDEIPLVVFSRNRSQVLVALSLEHFLKLTR
jgi:hypothetical protein